MLVEYVGRMVNIPVNWTRNQISAIGNQKNPKAENKPLGLTSILWWNSIKFQQANIKILLQ